MQCLTYALGEQFQLMALERYLKLKKSCLVNKHWRALELVFPEKDASIYVFKNGTLIAWNFTKKALKEWIELVQDYAHQWYAQRQFDGYHYIHPTEKTKMYPHAYFNVDCLELEEDDHDLRLGLSYGLSQSIKLKYYEEKMEALIERYSPLTHQLSVKGRIDLPRRQLQKIIGEIVSVKSEINLLGDFLYQPKFFWQHPNLESEYAMLARYLDIRERAEMLNRQINTLSEIFMLFNGYLEQRHASTLEIIIILLIAVEVVFNFLKIP